MLSQKKEQFELSLQKQRREEVFKLKRQSISQEIPFSEINSNDSEQYYQAFTQSLNYLENHSGMQFENDIVITIAYISHLNKSLEQCECDPQYDNAEDIEKVFQVFNKGYPVIDKACLNILREFTLYSHALCQPILSHIPEIGEYFVISKYRDLKSISMNIFGNLAADCQICRDRILIYDVPKIIHDHISQQEKELREDYLTLLININHVKPDLANQYYVQLSPIVHFCYQHNLESSVSVGLLNFIKKCYATDKTLINYNFLAQLIQNQYNQDQLSIILSILAQYSTQSREQSQALSLAIVPYTLAILKNASGMAIIPKQTNKNIQTACIILYNLALDGIQFADQIFYQGLQEILITYFYKFSSIIEFNSLIFILLSSCSQKQLESINQNAQLMKLIIRNFNAAIMNDENIKSNLDMLLVIMHRDNSSINVFIEENGENLIGSLQRHHDQEISDICDRIFALLDNE